MASCEFQDQLTQFLPKMRVWALGLTRNAAAADDLVQDVALKTLMANEILYSRHQLLRLGASHHDQSIHFCRAQSPGNRRHRPGAGDGRSSLAAG